MSTPLVINGVTYNIPAYNDVGWGQGSGNLSAFLIAVGNIASAVRLIGTNISLSIPQSSAVSSTGTTNNFDITTISLTVGTWLVSGAVGFGFGAAGSISKVLGGIGTGAGASGAGLILGTTQFAALPPTSVSDSSAPVPIFIKSVLTTTPIYLKANMTFTGSAPVAYGAIAAVQIA